TCHSPGSADPGSTTRYGAVRRLSCSAMSASQASPEEANWDRTTYCCIDMTLPICPKEADVPTALVTGVSRGLGWHVCQALMKSGYRVLGVGTAASQPGLAGYRSLDLREPLPPDLFDGEEVDVLVNSAGVY